MDSLLPRESGRETERGKKMRNGKKRDNEAAGKKRERNVKPRKHRTVHKAIFISNKRITVREHVMRFP